MVSRRNEPEPVGRRPAPHQESGGHSESGNCGEGPARSGGCPLHAWRHVASRQPVGAGSGNPIPGDAAESESRTVTRGHSARTRDGAACRHDGDAVDDRARRRARADDLVGSDHRRQLPEQHRGALCGGSRPRAVPRRPADAARMEPGAGRLAAIGVRRRGSRRLAHAVRRVRDRPRTGDQHGELQEDHGVQHDGPGCRHRGSTVGCQQPALAALRLRPFERHDAGRGDQFAVLRDGDGR